MKIRYPQYYNAFRCLAAACPDSCCHQWEVEVDSLSADRYRALAGSLGEDLRQVLREKDGLIFLTNTPERRCPMWRDDGLCRIQAELGHDALCATCRDFPRLRHDYGCFTELGLELSCPEAARLILASCDPPWEETEVCGGSSPEYDTDVMKILLATRENARAILNDPTLTPGQALAVLLLYGNSVQYSLDFGGEPDFSPARDLEAAAKFTQPGSAAEILALFRDLEILTPRWRELLGQPPGMHPWQTQHRCLARYFVDRYWLQAVADGDLFCRVKFLITACLVIRVLGGDTAQTAQLFSKEIENDPDNVEALLELAYTSPALTDRKLLGLLLDV